MKRMIATLKPEAQVWALLDGRALWRNLGDRQRTLQDGSESLALAQGALHGHGRSGKRR